MVISCSEMVTICMGRVSTKSKCSIHTSLNSVAVAKKAKFQSLYDSDSEDEEHLLRDTGWSNKASQDKVPG